MSDTCNHDCSGCGENNCDDRTQAKGNGAPQKEKLHKKSTVKKVIGVVSGKGGVGKSLVTSLMASEMARKGFKTAILDSDITGPSIPKAFGLHSKAVGDEDGIYPVISNGGIQIMSINFLLENETDPVLWRGPILAGAVKQFWTDVIWTDVDFMFVDMPPGTGDVPLTVFQSLAVDGIIVVSTPQELVGMIVQKAVKMAETMGIPVLGLVENMSYAVCPKCGEHFNVFGKSHVKEIAAQYNIPVTAQIPINPEIAAACDAGKIENIETGCLEDIKAAIEAL
jgi:Mrp family chromosome partitioning ATPase